MESTKTRLSARTEKEEGLFQENLKKQREKLLKVKKEIDSTLSKYISPDVEENRQTYKIQIEKLKIDLHRVYTELVDFLVRNKEEQLIIEEKFNYSRYLEQIESTLGRAVADTVSHKSESSSRSSKYRAKAEAAKVKLQYIQQEVELKKQQAVLAAELELLNSRKEVAALEAEAGLYEALSDKCSVVSQPLVNSRQKTEEYVNSLFVNKQQNENQNISSEVVQCLYRKDVLLSRLSKFSDNPAYFSVWKATFKSVVNELRLSAREEIDLLLKWLGPSSTNQAWSIHASNANAPEKSLERIWQRLEERFAAPEIVHSTITRKISSFPRISTDLTKLYDLADVTTEIEYLKEDPKLALAFSLYDSSIGVNQLVTKLPHYIQDKWTNKAVEYKRKYDASYPAFSVFAQFIGDQARDRNDPSFGYETERLRQRGKRTEFSVKKTDTKQSKDNLSNTTDSLEFNCLFHDLPHSLNKCTKFRKLPLSDRKHQLFVNRVCFKCCESKKHLAGECKASIKCDVCASNTHSTALHDFGRKPKSVSDNSGENSGSKRDVTDTRNSIVTKHTNLNKGDKFKSCAKALLVKVYKKDRPNHYMLTYALIDDQSNRSLAKTELLDYFSESSSNIEYTLSSCGGQVLKSGRVSEGFVVESMRDNEKIELSPLIECNDIPNNKDEIPTPEVCEQFSHLKGLKADIPKLQHQANMLLLIGRDNPTAHHVLEQIVGEDNEPFAQKLRLGWVIVGEVCYGSFHSSRTVNVSKTYILNNQRPSLFKSCDMTFKCDIQSSDVKTSRDFDSVGSAVFERTIHDNKIGPSIEDKQFIRVTEDNWEKTENGNWIFPLPFKEKSFNRPLPSNFQSAKQRTDILCQSLKKNSEKCEDFCQFMGEMLKNGHAEIAPSLQKGEEHWYLPIFGVYHPRKPRKIRVVFDSSAKYNGVCLNDVLMTGPDLTNSLIGVLLRFRKHKIAVIADIQQMFFCFYVKPEHRNFLRFLWFRDNDQNKNIIEYRMCVHVFGNSPSPAIATYGLHRTITSQRNDFGEDTFELCNR